MNWEVNQDILIIEEKLIRIKNDTYIIMEGYQMT